MNPVSSHAPLQFLDFQLDPLERSLLCAGRPVPLVPKSFDLLCVFVQNSGKLLDKAFLLNAVWSDAEVEENSIARAVADIRRALGEGPKENRFIATISGRGYRFVPSVATLTDAASQPELASTAQPRLRLAVLPFEWLTPQADAGSLEVGLADAIITRLSRFNQIVVRPTSAIIRYAHTDRDPLAAARDLNVDFVLTGSLRRSADRIRVSIQVICADQERTVWAEHLDEDSSHIFGIEDAVSERVAAALYLHLSSAQKDCHTRGATQDNEAYQLYLRGRYFWSRQTFTSAQNAISYFRRAVQRDPSYARAFVGIADAYVLMGLAGALTGGLPPHVTYPEAERSALKAIELDESLAEAHAALGFVRFFYNWDAAAAENEFHHALTLHPRYVPAYHGQALTFGFLGRFQEAIAALDKSLQIEPLSPILNANKGYFMYAATRYGEAIHQLRKTLEIEPSFAATHYRLGLALSAQGETEKAIQHFEESRRLTEDSPQTLAALGYLYAEKRNESAARAIVERLNQLRETRYVSAASFAEVHLGLGEFPQASEYLGKALEERSAAMFSFRIDPRFERARKTPVLQRPLAEMDRAQAQAHSS